MITNPRHRVHTHACSCSRAGTPESTHRIKVVEEADAGRVRRLQGELEEGLHIQWGGDDRRAPEEGRDRPRSVYTSCGRCTNREIGD